MIKESVFCDLCRKHINSKSDGKSFFFERAGRKSTERIFQHTTKHDISICNSCISDIRPSFKETKKDE